MSKILLSTIAFIGVCLFACLIFWLGGYNFDQRNLDVAFGAFMTFLLAATLSVLIYITSHNE